MELSPTTLWLLAGVLLFVAEALGANGMGLFFAGFAALLTGALLQLGILDSDATIVQFVVFFAATAIFSVLLWKPLKKFRINRGGGYSNMVGDTVVVGSAGVRQSMGGDVTWSGTIMKAELAPDAGVDSLPAGSQAIITSVRGATLIVKPKN
jgi:membrane protein implicated in regulation of membrane protease activity